MGEPVGVAELGDAVGVTDGAKNCSETSCPDILSRHAVLSADVTKARMTMVSAGKLWFAASSAIGANMTNVNCPRCESMAVLSAAMICRGAT